MSDRNREDGDAAENDDEEHGEEYEVDRLVSREDGAAALRRLADGVANGSVELGDDAVSVVVPERFELEIEYEGESEEAELEVELEWPIVDGEAVPAERGSDPTEGDDGEGDAETAEAGEEGEPDEASRADEARETDETDAVSKEEDASGEATAAAEAEPPIAEVVGVGGPASNARFELYRDRADEWRWRLVHDNGNIIADSGEGYDRKATARNGLESVMRNALGARVVEDGD